MHEFEELVKRTHKEGLEVIIDFVPTTWPDNITRMQPAKLSRTMGADDNQTLSFSPYNNYYYIPQTEFKGQFDLKAGGIRLTKEYPAKATGNNLPMLM